MIRRLRGCPGWLLLAIIALVPRLITLGAERLWFDEAFTWLVVQPQTDFWGAVLGDDHPPLWNAIQWLNVRLFGESEFAFRLPAMLFSIGCVLLIYLLALRMTASRPSALLASILASLLPGFIYFGQDGRMYAALAFFVLLTLWAVIERRWWIVFGAGLAACYTQNVGVLYVVGIGAWVVMTRVRVIWMLERAGHIRILFNNPVKRWLIHLGPLFPFAGIGLLYLPWLPILLIQAGRVAQSFWMPPFTALNWLWPIYMTPFSGRIPDILQVHFYAVWTALILVGLYVSWRWIVRTKDGRYWLVAFLAGPVLLAVYSLLSTHNIYVYRPLLTSTLLLTIPAGYALTNLRIEVRPVAQRVTFAMLLIGLALYNVYGVRVDIPAIEKPITDAWQPGDLMLYTDGTPAILFGHYLLDKPTFLRMYHGDVMSITDPARNAFRFPVCNLTYADSCFAGYKRVWWIFVRNPFTEPSEIAAIESLTSRYHPTVVYAHNDSRIAWTFVYRIDLEEDF
jgi:4-amino-4-deoxy-L-arabinose transferase-like glycosyltransferase